MADHLHDPQSAKALPPSLAPSERLRTDRESIPVDDRWLSSCDAILARSARFRDLLTFFRSKYFSDRLTGCGRKWGKSTTIPYFRIYDLRSTYATRLSAGGVADEWVTQMLRPGDAKAFKKYSQMKLQMKREALEKINRRANEQRGFDTVKVQ
ncbi:MAG: hypothetical protein ACLPWF_19605 [Bryobacteraceae bacterium]